MSSVELAKSGRASCRICKQKIEKDTPRLGIESQFSRDGNTYTSIKWHHFTCAIEKNPEDVSTASLADNLDEDVLNQIKEIKAKLNRSGFSLQSILEIEKQDQKVNIKSIVKRKLRVREVELNGEQTISATTYVEEGDQRRKIILWGKHAELELNEDDIIVVLSGLSEYGSDDKLQLNAFEESFVLINPKPEEIEKYSTSISVYTSDKWERPSGTKCEFEYAKSGRAACFKCKESINKGELKITQPLWMENEKIKHKFPGNYSFHVDHVLSSEFGVDIFQEALTRISPDMFEENKEMFVKLKAKIKEKDVVDLLDTLKNMV